MILRITRGCQCQAGPFGVGPAIVSATAPIKRQMAVERFRLAPFRIGRMSARICQVGRFRRVPKIIAKGMAGPSFNMVQTIAKAHPLICPCAGQVKTKQRCILSLAGTMITRQQVNPFKVEGTSTERCPPIRFQMRLWVAISKRRLRLAERCRITLSNVG